MRISSINHSQCSKADNSQNSKQNVSFGDNHIRLTQDAKRAINFTFINRHHSDTVKVAEVLTEMAGWFKHNVNVLFCGCSDGSEVYELVIELLKKFKEKSVDLVRFPVIKAFDQSQVLIDNASKGLVNIRKSAVPYIKDYADKAASEIVYPNDDWNAVIPQNPVSTYRFHDDLTKRVKFYVGDWINEISNINNDVPTVVISRNLAQYNSNTYQMDVARTMDKKLSPESLIVFGEYDMKHPDYKHWPVPVAYDLMDNPNFEQSTENIFIKIQ